MPAKNHYDAFLSLNSEDLAAVETIGRWLEDEAHLKIWLYTWNMIPGEPLQESMEEALDRSTCCVVFIGPNGIGPWQNEEMRTALEDRVQGKQLRVVPVILPQARRPQKESELPRFLRRLAWIDFRDVQDGEALHRLRCGILGIPPGRQPEKAAPAIVCPFRGLEVFREEDAPFFFGRDNVVQQLYDYLQHHRFLAVIGPSGSGKSSVMQAGLIPALKSRGAKSDGREAPFTPRLSPLALFTPQDDPFRELAIALRPLMTPPPLTYSDIITALMKDEKELEYISRGICRDTGEARLLLVIDQFEEVFTQTADEHKRQLFFDSLLNTVEAANSPTFIVLTMRSDFLGKCAAYADLNTFIIDHLFQIGPMSPKDLRDAIEEPAQRVGLEFEKGLVEIMLRDAAGAPGELPLIEHALLELYERRAGNLLTHAAYDKIGGIAGALTKRAELEFARLTPVQQEIFRKMFVMCLIQHSEDLKDTKRRATKEELLAAGGNAQETEMMLQLWTNARLLTTTRDDEKKQEFVEVAHEALIRSWSLLQRWLNKDREFLISRQWIQAGLAQWERTGRDLDVLLRGTHLSEAEHWLSERPDDLSQAEQTFIRASRERRQRLWELEKQTDYLIQATVSLINAETLDRVYDSIFENLHSIGYSKAMISLVDEVSNTIAAQKAIGENWKTMVEQTKIGLDSDYILAVVAKSGKAKLIEDCSTDPHCSTSIFQPTQVKSEYIIPLIVPNKVLGTLQIDLSDKQELLNGAKYFLVKSLSILDGFANQLAVAIDSNSHKITVDKLRLTLAGVGHELRSPLHIIISQLGGLIYLLDKNYGDDLQVKKITQVLEEEAFRAMRQMNNVLISTVEAGIKFEKGQISDTILVCTNSFRETANKRNIRIVVYDSVKKLPSIYYDKTQIEQVFTNLLDNAVKYSYSNQNIEIGGREINNKIEISIIDHGRGIPKNNYKRIFQAFDRNEVLNTPTSYIPGAGLGLAIAKEIVERHKGEIKVQSIPFTKDPEKIKNFEEYETTFFVLLPENPREA